MRLAVEISPHIKQSYDTGWVMRQVLIALLPAVAAAILFFRIRAVVLIFVCIAGCMLSEEIACRLRRRPSTLNDYSSIVTGLLLAIILPPAVPLWVAFLGAVVSVVIGKQIFGGFGRRCAGPWWDRGA